MKHALFSGFFLGALSGPLIYNTSTRAADGTPLAYAAMLGLVALLWLASWATDQ